MVNSIKTIKLNQRSQPSITKQHGVVLVVSLVFLIALTAVAAALMQNTTSDMKMSGASQVRTVALQETLSEMDRVIFNQVRKVSGANNFASPINSFPISPTLTEPDITIATITPANKYNLEADCPRALNGSSTTVFKCNLINVQLTRQYGRKNTSNININSSIAQQLVNVEI